MLLTIFLAIVFSAAISLMLISAVAFIQNKKFFSSAPKEAQELIISCLVSLSFSSIISRKWTAYTPAGSMAIISKANCLSCWLYFRQLPRWQRGSVPCLCKVRGIFCPDYLGAALS